MKGYPGVSITRVKDYRPRRGKLRGWFITYAYYKARIQINGKNINLGHYDTPEAAAEAYRKAKRKKRDLK